MTKEDKQLLLVDLCARLPYEVKCRVTTDDVDEVMTLTQIHRCDAYYFYNVNGCFSPVYGHDIKPYLRPMSSMTDEEMIDFLQVPDLSQVSKKFISNFKIGNFGIMTKMSDYARNIDWLNARHFDYRGLIDKGLAISTEVFNPYND